MCDMRPAPVTGLWRDANSGSPPAQAVATAHASRHRQLSPQGGQEKQQGGHVAPGKFRGTESEPLGHEKFLAEELASSEIKVTVLPKGTNLFLLGT